MSELRSDLIPLCREAIHKAGNIAQSLKNKIKIKYKSENQPVTNADIEINKYLFDFFKKETPKFGWLSEESTDDLSRLNNNFFWCLDPIDGTRSFISGKPEYISPSKIKVSTTGEGNRKVYETIEEAISNKLNLQPSPTDLAKFILEGDPVKPVRVTPCKFDKDHQYELIEGRLMFWAWIIAFKGLRDVPCLIRNSFKKV